MSPSADPALLFQSWLEEHRGIVVKVTRSFTTTPADAADLQQELLLQLWISLSSFAGQAKASTWIYRVCLNTALTWRRGTVRREQRLEPTADFAHVAGETATPRSTPASGTARATLRGHPRAAVFRSRAGVALPRRLAYREISEITGLNENQVGVALTRARQRLAQLMKGVTDELE
ncbi:MAG: RNA polymerase sigma factor [Lacunisphaera sp.]